jgi:hypothetical protein
MDFEKTVTPEYIKKVLDHHGIKRGKLCTYTGIDPASLQRFMNGDRGMSKGSLAAIYWWDKCQTIRNDLITTLDKYK